jgi:hypothetical protein
MSEATQLDRGWISAIAVEQRRKAADYFKEVIRGESQGLQRVFSRL